MNEAIPIYGYRAELSANRTEKKIGIKVYHFGWNKDSARLSELIRLGFLLDYYIVSELKNYYMPFEKWNKEYFVGKILRSASTSYRELEIFEFDINIANQKELEELTRILFFKSHREKFREIKEWNIELWDFRGVLLRVEEKSLDDIKNIGISYLALWK